MLPSSRGLFPGNHIGVYGGHTTIYLKNALARRIPGR
jgi:hypothetical protein